MKLRRKDIEIAYDNDHAATVVLLAPRWLVDHPDDIAATAWYADMLYQMTRYEEAIEVLLAAIEREDEDLPRHLLLLKIGALERYRGNFAESEKWYGQAIELQPDDATGYVFLGAAQARQGKLHEAEATHRQGTACRDGAADESFHNLGLVLRAQGRLEEAAEAFRSAIKLDPDYESATEALEDVENAIQLIAGMPH